MSNKYKLIILPEAQADIRAVGLYIASELSAPQAAIRLLDSFEEGIHSLAEMPERFKVLDEQPWKDAEVRKIRVKNYYIYYVVSKKDQTVKIMAVIYVGRDQEKQMIERAMDMK